MGKVSGKLTIFEGSDGSGKTTAALEFAERTGAKYVHFTALPRVGKNLARMYVEAMMPALLGYQDVVFDRCWLSEIPYGVAFREGRDRLNMSSRRMLERLALRCGAVVVQCRPAYEVVKANYLSRKHLELLDNDSQLQMVYDLYQEGVTDLPELVYDYTSDPISKLGEVTSMRTPRHPTDLASAGNLHAQTVLVGEAFAERKDCDPWYQWPFASFSGEGCSQWLTGQLDLVEVSEFELLWVNADQDLSWLAAMQPTTAIALGDVAAGALRKLGVVASVVPHPQAWKRFNGARRYPLLDLL